MIEKNEEQHLGHKAFIFFLWRYCNKSIVIFIAAAIIAFGRMPIISLVTGKKTFDGASALEIYSYDFVLLIFTLAFILFIIGYVSAYFEYKNYSFTLEEYSLKVRKGIMSKEEISVPYRQIQDVNIERSFIYQIFGVSRLVFITAGREEPDIHEETEAVLDPLEKNVAEEVREELLRHIGVQKVENENIKTP